LLRAFGRGGRDGRRDLQRQEEDPPLRRISRRRVRNPRALRRRARRPRRERDRADPRAEADAARARGAEEIGGFRRRAGGKADVLTADAAEAGFFSSSIGKKIVMAV